MPTPKVDTAVKKTIIEMSIQGKTSVDISAEIAKTRGISIDDSTIRIWRLKFKEQINKKRDSILARAYAVEALALPENRLALLNENIEREKKKKRPDGKVINDAIRFAGEDIRSLELIRLKETELQLKKAVGEGSGETGDELIVKLEKRITISRKVSVENRDIEAMVEWAKDET